MYSCDETSVKRYIDVGIDLDIEILNGQETGMIPPINETDSCKDSDPETGS